MHLYGWQPSVIPPSPDQTFDKFVASESNKELVSLSENIIDWRKFCSPVENQQDIGSCHDDKTEVLTNEGWKLFADLTGKELLASINPLNNELIYEKPSKLFRFNFKGNLICSTNNRSLDFRVTPDHKMLVRQWDQNNKTLKQNYELIAAKDIGWYVGFMNRVHWKGINNYDTFTIPGVPDHKHKPQRINKIVKLKDWLQFLGIYLAEGTLLKRNNYCNGKASPRYKIQLAAAKDREVEFIFDLLNRLDIKFSFRKDRFEINNRQIYECLSSMGLEKVHAGEKFVPSFVFDQNSEMIKEFLLGHFMGDGSEQNNHRSHYTSSEKMAIDLQLLIFLSGNESYISIRGPRSSTMKDGRIVQGKLNEYRVSVSENKNLSINRKKQIEEQYYDGEVFCAEVPTYHTLVTRRNNKILISGNCVANAIVSNLEFLEIKNGLKYTDLSRMFLYYNARLETNTTQEDKGSNISAAFGTLKKHGVCSEKTYPYDPSKVFMRPSWRSYQEAFRHTLTQSYKIENSGNKLHYDILTALRSCHPVVFGTEVWDSFRNCTGLVQMPDTNTKSIGRHAMLIVGVDLNTNRYIVRNSWGTSWGDKGYCYFPFEYFDAIDTFEFWTATKVQQIRIR